MVTAAFLALCSSSGSNAEPDAAIEHAAAPVEAAQGPNMTVVTDRDANVSICELRNYRAKPGGAVHQWLDAFTAALPAREKYSKIVGLWQTEAGQPNEVCHIWAYPSLNARAEARGNALKDPVWQEFLGRGGQLLDEMHSTIMLPAPHSPLK